MHPEMLFHQLRAADLMSRELVLIPDDMLLQEAARRLVRAGVSGAPVVDCRGAVVGVLSASDFIRHATQVQKDPSSCNCICAEWQVVDVESLPAESVHRCMTTDPITALEDAPVAALARQMVEAHIHRIIIVDEDNSPKGIVTSGDILAAVARLVPAEELHVQPV